ncbi:MAG: tryptophan synthase subunit alpha [Syntrophus sp. (in: bacteria)]|nr:tryptophan synthase subunit alpha [Syntrophus sp. (in: bacteria)]
MGKLGIYLLVNYPSAESFIRAVKVCEERGVDFLEVGFPFSDPVADGDLLERASYETLKRFNFDDFTESLQEARRIFKGRVYVMTYANVVFGMGINAFAKRVEGITGIILADVPLREIWLFEKGFKKQGINLVRFLTPESRAQDIEKALKGAGDFIYFVSKRGTTGGDFTLDEETIGKIGLARGRGADVYIGFGIKEKKDVDLACSVADGAIIGTKAVEGLEKGVEAFEGYIKGLRAVNE